VTSPTRIGRCTRLLGASALVSTFFAPLAAADTGTKVIGNARAGARVFAQNDCSSCHTMKAAQASGVVGPNFDRVKLPEVVVIAQVARGCGVMPSYKDVLSKKQIQNVAAYVYTSTHKTK
jgi:cytochrome c6